MQWRMRKHRFNAGSGSTALPSLYGELRLYGLEAFIIEIVEQCPEKDLSGKEDYWIEVLQTNIDGYNIRQKTDLRGIKQGEKSFLIHLRNLLYNLS